MSIHRIVRRLPARRQQRMLAMDAPRFVGLQLGAGDSGATFGVLAVFSLVATLANFGLGRWFDAPAPLGPLGVVGVAGVGTFAWVAMRALFDPTRRIAPALDRRALAAALSRELEVAGRTRAEIETLSWTATRAWIHARDDAVQLLVLECEAEQWVALRGPLVAARFESGTTIGQRFVVERLRWTGAMLSLSITGAELRCATLEPASLGELAECELWSAHELPPGLAAALERAGSGYR